MATPNPLISFTTVPGHERNCFVVYGTTGKLVGRYKGERIGEGLSAGVYFIKPEDVDAKPLRIVKVGR